VIERVAAAAVLLAAVTGLGGCVSDQTMVTVPAVAEAPAPPREFRGAWVATVSNIDWPSRPGLSADDQRAEAVAILDRARAIGLNALILQVRPAGDALYASALEPWSEVLSGTQGRAPEPAYDPLAFWVAQAHLRGLELEAWFNPYRARLPSARTPLVAPHIALRWPAAVKRYGDLLWMDPGDPQAAANTLAVIADVVRRYDIDGVQIDDYFYPYPLIVDGVEQPFPDDDSYARYREAGGSLARDDWRRANVDSLVEALYRTVHEIKPWVRFGVSPFGIGRPDRRPPGVVGFSQYDKLYADVESWLANGWVDYLAPQLYWPLASDGQPFAALLASWVDADTAGRAIWPGLFASQVGRSWTAQELLDQVAVLRSRAPAPGGAAAGPSGNIQFSFAALLQDRDGLATKLKQGPYAQPALVPAMPWLADQPPAAPRLVAAGTQVRVDPGAGGVVARWAVWRRAAGVDSRWRFEVLPANERIIDLAADRELAVSAVGRTGELSARAVVRLP
jgi:uncharacterized lipoprotein YddW (UPF0748 family)